MNRRERRMKITGTKLGILVILAYFLFQCEIVEAPVHEMYYDAPAREEVERTV